MKIIDEIKENICIRKKEFNMRNWKFRDRNIKVID